MDKDSIILKYEQNEVANAASNLETAASQNNDQSKELDELQEKMKRIYELTGKQPFPPSSVQLAKPSESTVERSTFMPPQTLTYDQLFVKASNSLVARGLDVDSLDYHSLVSEDELVAIEKELNRPLPRRERWTKGDFVAVFIASAIGSLADVILSNRNNLLTGTDSDFSKWLNQFHQHEGGGPIDYQGPHFGGGFHRGLSKGHDILRFIEGIMMFKNGQFEAVRYENGIAYTVISTVNQYGKPYEQLGVLEAIARYAKHMFADLFSTCSLPFPGSSFLVEADNRQMRQFAADMYKNGFNIKNVMSQGLSTIIIEVILRIYFSIQAVEKYKDEFEISEDYSNFEAAKHFFKQENKDKLDKMLLVAHSIVTAVNIGKVAIEKAPWEINVTEIVSVVHYGVKVLSKAIECNSEYAKLIRSTEKLHEGWSSLEQSIRTDEQMVLSESSRLIIA